MPNFQTNSKFKIPNSTEQFNLLPILEALLFVAGEPLSISKLADLSDHSISDVKTALMSLEQAMSKRGILLLQKDEAVTLVTAPHLAPYIEKLIKEEVLGDISKTALETLTIIAYRHPISRSDIDYIRGVNSWFTVRNLMARGLVERMVSSKDRAYQYQPTMEFMKFLGLSSFHELPEYTAIQHDFTKGIEQNTQKET